MYRFVIAFALLGCTVGTELAEEAEDEDSLEEPDEVDEPEPSPDALAAPAPLAAGCVAKGSLAGHPTWVFFTRPDRPCRGVAGSGVDTNAIAELTRLIKSVPAGGRIDGHIFNLTADGVAKALLDAQQRGVTVRISADGQLAHSTDTAKTQYLDKLASIVYCTSATGRGCVSSKADAISHTKLFAFSTATAPDGAVANDVVWFGSANQTRASGMKLYNNTVTVYGDTGLATKLGGYLDDLFQRRRTGDYYDPRSGRGHILAGAADVYVSPEAETDLVVHRLDDITPTSDCEVRVMQASVRDTRIGVVSRLVALKQGGCTVKVVAHTVGPKALKALKAAHIPVKQMPIHDKAFIVFGKYGNTRERRVYTGSHNLSGGSAHAFDEIFVKLAAEGANHPIYDAYVTHFADAFTQGAPL